MIINGFILLLLLLVVVLYWTSDPLQPILSQQHRSAKLSWSGQFSLKHCLCLFVFVSRNVYSSHSIQHCCELIQHTHTHTCYCMWYIYTPDVRWGEVCLSALTYSCIGYIIGTRYNTRHLSFVGFYQYKYLPPTPTPLHLHTILAFLALLAILYAMLCSLSFCIQLRANTPGDSGYKQWHS